jgi:hypothetical protein
MRGAAGDASQELWSIRVDGTEERKHHDLGTFRPIDRFFDVSARDEVVWAPSSQGRRELWIAVVQ